MQEPGLTHLDEQGRARMVDVGQKPVSARQAVAEAYVILQSATLRSIVEGKVPKGEVLGTARVAAIMAAKKCGELIPLCHPLPIESATVKFELPEASTEQNARLRIVATVQITAKTGVEMEALTAVSVAALTIYDMCKAIDKSMVIEGIRLLKKSGGMHGDYEAKDQR